MVHSDIVSMSYSKYTAAPRSGPMVLVGFNLEE